MGMGIGVGDAALAAGTGGLSIQGQLAGKALLGNSGVPQQQAVDLDPATKGLLDKQRQFAGENTQQIAGETMQGAEALGQKALANPAEMNMKASALGMANPSDLGSQLAARGQRSYQSDIARLQNQANLNAGDRMLTRQQQALQNEQQLNHIHQQAYNTALNNEMQKRKARGQMIGNVLGIGGMIAGGALGGPKGIGAGGKVGQSAGEGIGGAGATDLGTSSSSGGSASGDIGQALA